MPGGRAQAVGPQMMMMPLFQGAPWIPKFKGTRSEVKLGEWKAQIKIMLSQQTLSIEQQTAMVLGALEGEAKREILDKHESGTVDQICELLELYGDRAPIVALCTRFFSSAQDNHESIQAFSLHLRERFSHVHYYIFL